jgi:hypothetical protein
MSDRHEPGTLIGIVRNPHHGIVLLWLLQEKGVGTKSRCARKQFREDEPAHKARVAKTLALIADIREPLRSELTTLIRDHKTMTATKRYQETSGQDYQTCMMIITR